MREILTVILPSLNVSKYIRQCLDSVTKQTYKDLEIICVDAGSTDGTLEVIKEYAKKDERIQVVNCSEKSYGKQVNMAMDIAAGKYIAIADTDDFLSLDMYESLVTMAERYQLDYIKSNYYEYYKFEDERIYQHKKSIISEEELYNRVINPRNYPQLHCQDGYLWCGIYNLEFLKRYNIRFNTTSGAAFQDVGFFHQVTYYAENVMYIDDYGYNYRIAREGNSIASPNGLKYMLQEYSRLICLKLVPEHEFQQWKCIYKKMILSFVAECDKKVIYSSFETDTVMPYLKSAVELIKNSINNYYLDNKDFNDKYWEKLNSLLEDKPRFVYNQTEKAKSVTILIDACIKHINKYNENGHIVVYGCGVRGKRLEELLMKNGVYVNGFVDRNINKIGEIVDGIPVNTLEYEKTYDTLYLVSVKNCENEIEKYLVCSGINKENILIPGEHIWK